MAAIWRDQSRSFFQWDTVARGTLTPTLSPRERELARRLVEAAPSPKPNLANANALGFAALNPTYGAPVAWKKAQPFPLERRGEGRPHPNPLPEGEGAVRAGVWLHSSRQEWGQSARCYP